MAQVMNPYLQPGNLLQLNPLGQDVNPGYLQLPQAVETAPMPYSPEGWQLSKLAGKRGEAAPTPPPAQEKKEEVKKDVGFTPDQALAMQKLVTGGNAQAPRVGGGGGAGLGARGQVPQMQMLQPGTQRTDPRASLGQILYGGRKF